MPDDRQLSQVRKSPYVIELLKDVDERQIAAALRVGAESAQEYGYQYIVTMNSDVLPGQVSGGLRRPELCPSDRAY